MLGHPRRRQLLRLAPHQALRPHEGPALQPLRPDPQGGGRAQGGREDHLLPAPARHGARPGPPEGVPGALAQAQGRVRGPGPEPGQGAGLRRARAVADPRRREGRQARAASRTTASRTSRTRSSRSPATGKKTVCLAEGEGERSGEDSGDRGFSGVKASLTKSLYEVKNVFLLREKKVPADCTVLVVGGPEKDLLPETTAAIRDYVKAGGKALVMVEPELKEHYPNLVALLKEWNIEAGNDVVVDVSGMGQLFGFSELAPLAIEYPYHAITKDFRLPTLYGGARSVAGRQGHDRRRHRAGPREDVGAVLGGDATSPSRARSSSTRARTTRARSPSPRWRPCAAPRRRPRRRLAAGSPSPSPGASPSATPEPPKAPEGRVVAVGDADFASNALLGFQGNQDFFLNTVAWLAEDADLISIRPKEPENQALFLSRQVQQNVAWLALVILPGLFVVAGRRELVAEALAPMKEFWKTGVALVVLAGLGSYIWFVERKQEPKPEGEREKVTVLAVDKAKAKEVDDRRRAARRITARQGGLGLEGRRRPSRRPPTPRRSTRCSRASRSWRPTRSSPRRRRASPTSASTSPSRTVVGRRSRARRTPLAVEFGAKSPDGSSVYASQPGRGRRSTSSPSWVEGSLRQEAVRPARPRPPARQARRRAHARGRGPRGRLRARPHRRRRVGVHEAARDPRRPLGGRRPPRHDREPAHGVRRRRERGDAKEIARFGLDKPSRTVAPRDQGRRQPRRSRSAPAVPEPDAASPSPSPSPAAKGAKGDEARAAQADEVLRARGGQRPRGGRARRRSPTTSPRAWASCGRSACSRSRPTRPRAST